MTNQITLSVGCRNCRMTTLVPVKEKDLERYQAGESVQHCFPYLNDDLRELLLSRICPVCWDQLFGEEEENE